MTTPDSSNRPRGSYPQGPGFPAGRGAQNPGIRASDADRDQILAQLSEHYQAGRLTTAEFDERSSQALGARTVGDLAGLMTDLPAGPGSPGGAPGTPGPAQAPARQRRLGLPVAWAVLAVLGVVAVIAVLSHDWHGSDGGWGFIIPVLIILRIFAVRRGRHWRRH